MFLPPQVNFAYSEAGISKSALVKVRLCPRCAYKMHYRKIKQAQRDAKARLREQRRKDRADRRQRKRLRSKQKEISAEAEPSHAQCASSLSSSSSSSSSSHDSSTSSESNSDCDSDANQVSNESVDPISKHDQKRKSSEPAPRPRMLDHSSELTTDPLASWQVAPETLVSSSTMPTSSKSDEDSFQIGTCTGNHVCTLCS
jgi:hypothetical protein